MENKYFYRVFLETAFTFSRVVAFDSPLLYFQKQKSSRPYQ